MDDFMGQNGGVSIDVGIPIDGLSVMENPTKMDGNWGYSHFRKPPDGKCFDAQNPQSLWWL